MLRVTFCIFQAFVVRCLACSSIFTKFSFLGIVTIIVCGFLFPFLTFAIIFCGLCFVDTVDTKMKATVLAKKTTKNDRSFPWVLLFCFLVSHFVLYFLLIIRTFRFNSWLSFNFGFLSLSELLSELLVFLCSFCNVFFCFYFVCFLMSFWASTFLIMSF